MSEAAGVAAGAAAGNGGEAAAAAAAAAPWHQGVEPEVLGHWQNKGIKLDSPRDVAIEMTKAARAAQAHIGAPPELIVRLPKDASDEAGWKTVYGRLGVPNDAKEYDFSAIKRANGKEVDAPLADALRPAMLNARVPKDRAGEVVAAVVKHLDGVEAEATAQKTAKLAEEKTALSKNWGPNEAANKFIASQAAQKLGITPETVAALEGVIGYSAIMEMFHKIGRSIGEDKYVNGEQPNSGIMSRDQAVARKAELMADKAWVARKVAGDAAANREMRALNIIITGDDGTSYAA
jgi:hypothetical protein